MVWDWPSFIIGLLVGMFVIPLILDKIWPNEEPKPKK